MKWVPRHHHGVGAPSQATPNSWATNCNEATGVWRERRGQLCVPVPHYAPSSVHGHQRTQLIRGV